MSQVTRKDLFANAAADFDHPLEMLAACHDRIEERCALLHRLSQHLEEAGADSQARQAAVSSGLVLNENGCISPPRPAG